MLAWRFCEKLWKEDQAGLRKIHCCLRKRLRGSGLHSTRESHQLVAGATVLPASGALIGDGFQSHALTFKPILPGPFLPAAWFLPGKAELQSVFLEDGTFLASRESVSDRSHGLPFW